MQIQKLESTSGVRVRCGGGMEVKAMHGASDVRLGGGRGHRPFRFGDTRQSPGAEIKRGSPLPGIS